MLRPASLALEELFAAFVKEARGEEGLRVLLPVEFVREGTGLLPGGALASPEAAAPRRATFIWPEGTCHVARYWTRRNREACYGRTSEFRGCE